MFHISYELIYVHLGELLPKQQAKIDFIVRANGAGKDTTESTVTSKENPLPRRLFTNIVTKPGKIKPHDLEIIQSTDNQYPSVGEIINIVIYLRNDGLDAAGGVIVNLSLPEQIEIISVEPQYSSYNKQQNSWNVAVLSENISRSLRIKAKITKAGDFSTVAEVIAADFEDLDSIVNNGKVDEDDYSILNFTSML